MAANTTSIFYSATFTCATSTPCTLPFPFPTASSPRACSLTHPRRFNFGNETTRGDTNVDADADAKGASIQFLSRTNRDQVYADFEGHRKSSLKVYPPLFDLTRLHTNGSIDGGGRLEPPSVNVS